MRGFFATLFPEHLQCTRYCKVKEEKTNEPHLGNLHTGKTREGVKGGKLVQGDVKTASIALCHRQWVKG